MMNMAVENGSSQKRHNPVDSICRKIQTIQRLDQEANPTLQIPKFLSRNFDSPQTNLKKNLEVILKNRTIKDEKDLLFFSSPDCDKLNYRETPDKSSCLQWSIDSRSPANATYTISSMKADQSTLPWPWTRSCSTPANLPRESCFTFQQSSIGNNAECKSIFFDKVDNLGSPMLCNVSSRVHSQKSRQSFVVKRLSLGEDTASRTRTESRIDGSTEVSLISEEDLLDTIFHACDTRRRGKVVVSRIVDYLRHTTSRGSEDSGLEELCNMLDPEHRDISIDLDTYRAIMKEWIEDCRNKGNTSLAASTTGESSQILRENLLPAARSVPLNVTIGSLEAFGGEVSRGDLETSDLVYCVADLQFNNQKLLDEMRKMKHAVETTEEANHKLVEEIEKLRAHARSGQQAVTKMKELKEELEELKVNLSQAEENRVKSAARSKQLEKDNQSLISQINLLEEENFRNTENINSLQKKLNDLCNINADLQVQIHSLDSVLSEKNVLLRNKNTHIEELRGTISEYSSLIELLRNEKNKLETRIQLVQQDLATRTMGISGVCVLNRTLSGSLHSELTLAQQSPEPYGKERTSISSLDETLDRDIFMFLQSPEPDQMCAEFKNIIQKLTSDFSQDAGVVAAYFKHLTETQIGNEVQKKTLETLTREMEEKRDTWIQNLQQLERHKSSLEKELLKMGNSIQGSRAEIATLKKDLSSRLRELEAQKRLQEEAEYSVKSHCEMKEAASQTEPAELGLPNVPEEETRGCELMGLTSSSPGLVDNQSSLLLGCQALQNNFKDKFNPAYSSEEALSSGHICQETKLDHMGDAEQLITSGVPEEAFVRNKVEVDTGIGEVSGDRQLVDGDLQSPDKSRVSTEKLASQTTFKINLAMVKNMDAIQENEGQMCGSSSISDKDSSVTENETPNEASASKNDNGSASPNDLNDKEIEAEFHRLSLGFKCDMFTLEKRLRLEERSRYLAEENLKKEVNSCKELIEALGPFCKDSNQTGEILDRLHKNIDVLMKSMNRVATNSEMLGAIHQESRVSKAVEIMIQHVENLKRMYAKEHAELEELKQNLLENERSFGSYLDRDNLGGKKLPNSQFNKSNSQRRVSIAAIPRNVGNAVLFELPKLHETVGGDVQPRRPHTWKGLGGKQYTRPTLQRFISTSTWAEAGELSLNKGPEQETEITPTVEKREEVQERKASLSEKGNKISIASTIYNSLFSHIADYRQNFTKPTKGLWISLFMIVLFAAFIGLIAGFALQPAADAAPVGTGDSWVAIQQLLWPYTGLRHHGQPPV
ncbi:inositol 1,4,5-triphosphate receptor associated 2 isoform X3 [Polypterus senegalus]|uniref:inositol 1,4,5-triphosphate receptor associated 2 isoform X3 n=1 Tax=Polypterus senegalus TaxID=55291 RepID=UPI0019648A7D|nr:inositol 1,4,5-triphosphate receptor associated 2 isoform X3 [Polypterus senegalus]